MKEKKQSELSVLLGYAGKYKALTFLGMFLSAVAMVMGMAPYGCIWLAARDLIAVAPNWTEATNIATYGWMAFGFSFGGILVYFAALMCTHLAAFRTAANIRKQGVARMMKAPLGFFDNYGSGKSTCARLAARLWDIQSGRIKVGGVDISTVDPEVLLTDYSMVFQDVVLFDDTVMENIRLGKHGATDAEVLAAAKAANCDEFVSRLPEGYATPIGENGAKLSGGERQRISIARALLKNAPIVLLDEATASLSVQDTVPVIASFLDSPTPLLRECAVNALGRIGRASFPLIEPYWMDLFRFASDEDAKVRLSFIWTSENIAVNTPGVYQDSMPVFEKLLHDADDRVRMEAPEIFRVIGKRRPEFIRPFLEALRQLSETDENRVVRIHCLGAIKAAGPR